MSALPGRIVHICRLSDWQAAQAAGEYRHPSLDSEGFIHFSLPEQALATANRFYAGQAGLAILWVETARLRAPLRLEAADGQQFPHLYGALNLEAVTAVTPFAPEADGVFRALPGEG